MKNHKIVPMCLFPNVCRSDKKYWKKKNKKKEGSKRFRIEETRKNNRVKKKCKN